MLSDGLAKVSLKEIPKVTYQSLWCGCGSLVDVCICIALEPSYVEPPGCILDGLHPPVKSDLILL